MSHALMLPRLGSRARRRRRRLPPNWRALLLAVAWDLGWLTVDLTIYAVTARAWPLVAAVALGLDLRLVARLWVAGGFLPAEQVVRARRLIVAVWLAAIVLAVAA